MKKISLIILGIVVIVLAYIYFATPVVNMKGAEYINTTSAGYSTATTSVGVYAVSQLMASTTNFILLQNIGTGVVSCHLDATDALAASSTVSSGYGITIGANNTTSTLSSQISFGECYPGASNCIAHKGSVNCIADATTTLIKSTR